MKPVDCRDRLDALLQAQQAQVATLARLLDEESDALKQTDPTLLEEITRRKIDVALELETLEENRISLLKQAGFSGNAGGMADCLSWCDPEGRLADRWTGILATLQSCRERNRANGHAINLQRRQTEAALCVLRGRQEPATYSSRGESPAAFRLDQRELGKA